MITHKQLTLAEVFEDCQNKFDNDKYQFLSLLDEAINLDEIVPVSFVTHFHASTGRPRKHQLYPMLKAFLIQRIFSIPTDMLLIVFLKYSQELRDFCGFDVVPDASKFTRFKQDFLMDLQSMFDHMVDMTEPICQKLDPHLAAMTIFDTSGIEAWVTENNPKYANRIIKQLKAFKKSHNLDDSYDPYKAAYGSMPTHAASNQAIQQMYINGHFCYAYKFGIVTNGLCIVRDITFYNKKFLKLIWISLWKRNLTLLMRINLLPIQKPCFLSWLISFRSIHLSLLRLFLVMLLLTRLKSTNLFSVKLDLKKHLFLSA